MCAIFAHSFCAKLWLTTLFAFPFLTTFVNNIKQGEAEVVPSSSLVKIRVSLSLRLRLKLRRLRLRLRLVWVKIYTSKGGWEEK